MYLWLQATERTPDAWSARQLACQVKGAEAKHGKCDTQAVLLVGGSQTCMFTTMLTTRTSVYCTCFRPFFAFHT